MSDDGCDVFWVVARKLCPNFAKTVIEFSKFVLYLSKSWSLLCVVLRFEGRIFSFTAPVCGLCSAAADFSLSTMFFSALI
jgi:hypothetical protein